MHRTPVKKKILLYVLAAVFFFLLYMLFTYPDNHRQINGPFTELEGTVVDFAADEFYVGEYGNSRKEVRGYITIRDIDGKDLLLLEPKSPSKEMSQELEKLRQLIKVKVTYGTEYGTGFLVIVSFEVLE